MLRTRAIVVACALFKDLRCQDFRPLTSPTCLHEVACFDACAPGHEVRLPWHALRIRLRPAAPRPATPAPPVRHAAPRQRCTLQVTKPSRHISSAHTNALDMQLPCLTLVARTSSHRATCGAPPPAPRAGSSSLLVNDFMHGDELPTTTSIAPCLHMYNDLDRSMLAAWLWAPCRSTTTRRVSPVVVPGHDQECQPVCAYALSLVWFDAGAPHDGLERCGSTLRAPDRCRGLS